LNPKIWRKVRDRMDAKCEEIRNYVRGVLGQPGAHGFDHIERVTAMCERIGREEDADMAILIPAALLHDIARPLEEERGIPHEIEGARMAEEYLASHNYDARCIPAIAHAIRAHRYSSGESPATPEARILSDADKLDAMGAAGIARTFLRAGEHGGTIEDGVAHFHAKLLHLPERMYTPAGRRIARERHAVLMEFLDQLAQERQG
jgi:uncharacterized protein